jgi:hypothetical protein
MIGQNMFYEVITELSLHLWLIWQKGCMVYRLRMLNWEPQFHKCRLDERQSRINQESLKSGFIELQQIARTRFKKINLAGSIQEK